MKSLYTSLKEHLPESKSVVSDAESLLLNRRDFHVSQISAVNANLNFLGVNVGYPYRVLLAFLDQVCGSLIKEDFNVILSDPSMAIAAYYCWMRSGGTLRRGRVYAPKGVGRFVTKPSLLGELLQEFAQVTASKPDSKPLDDRIQLFSIVLGNTKKPEQTIFAADRFAEVTQGLIILKDYGRVDAFDEREYLESKGIFPAVTFEGHAFALKM
jgi:hypothetical protein